MTPDELADELGVPLAVVQEKTAAGMPADSVVAAAGWLYRGGFLPTFEFVVATQREVATFFDVSRHTVRKEWVAAGMPGRRGRYPLHEIAIWKAMRRKDPANVSVANEDALNLTLELKRVELATKTAELQMKEIRAARAAGSIFYREEIEPLVAEALVFFKFELQQIPDAMMQRLPKRLRVQVRMELERKINAALVQLADRLAGVEGDLEKNMLDEQ